MDFRGVLYHNPCMKIFWGLIFLFTLPLILLSCTTSRPDSQFHTVQIGDSKGAVLYKIGNPQRTYFKDDTQRWVYLLKSPAPALPQEKEVWFQKDQVVYVDLNKTRTEKSPPLKKPIEFEPIK